MSLTRSTTGKVILHPWSTHTIALGTSQQECRQRQQRAAPEQSESSSEETAKDSSSGEEETVSSSGLLEVVVPETDTTETDAASDLGRDAHIHEEDKDGTNSSFVDQTADGDRGTPTPMVAAPEQAEKEPEDTLVPAEYVHEEKRPPTPAPRRSVRTRKQPFWMASGDYVMSHQVPQTDWTESTGWLNHILDTSSLPSWKIHAIISLIKND